MMERKRPWTSCEFDNVDEIQQKRTNYVVKSPFLPLELVENILRFLDDDSMLTCRLVCKTWLDLIDEDIKFWTSLSNKRGISVNDLPKKNGYNVQILVDEIKGRFRAMHAYDRSTTYVSHKSKVIGTHEAGVLICLNENIQFYKLVGSLMYNFLLKLEDESFDVDKYRDFLVFETPYQSPILTWTTNGEQIHLCSGNEVKIFNMSIKSDPILVEDMSFLIDHNRKEMRLIFLPNNIRVIKKRAKTGVTSGMSITFYSESEEEETTSQRALFLSDASKTLLILHHGGNDVEPTFSHNFSINGGGVHVKGGPYERSVDIFMGSSSLDETCMKLHSTCLFQNKGSKLINVEVNPIIFLACTPTDCRIATVGDTFIVLFNKTEVSLMYYKRPNFSRTAIIEAAFTVFIKSDSVAPDIDWDGVEFVFCNDVDEGQLGNIGKVELRQCSCRENENTFLVFCK